MEAAGTLDLDQEQRDALASLRSSLESDLGTILDVDDTDLVRFLMARKWEVPRAKKLWLNYRKLEDDMELRFRDIGFEDVRHPMTSGKLMHVGDAPDGTALLIFRGALHVPGVEPPGETLKALLYFLDRISRVPKYMHAGVTFVGDLHGFGWANFDMQLEKKVINVLQDRIPLRVRHMYMVDAPTIIRAVLAMLRPFMKKKLREKLEMVTRAELLGRLPEGSLPVEVGGTLSYDFDDWMARHTGGEFVTPQEMHKERVIE